MIWVDYREKDLIAQLDAYLTEGAGAGAGAGAGNGNLSSKPSAASGSSSTSHAPHAPFRTTNLPIGDVIISSHAASDDDVELTTDSILLIIERKTVMDMAASIRDGRYEEQGFRLNDAAVPNHNVVYLVEGDVQRVLATNRYANNRITPDAVYGAFASIMFFKGFSLYHSLHLSDTCAFLCHAHRKLHKEMGLESDKSVRSRESARPKKEGKRLYYSSSRPDAAQGEPASASASASARKDGPTSDVNAYEATLKKKQTYTTARGVQIAMLCQIPKVSVVIATALVDRFGSLSGVARYIGAGTETEGAARLLAEFKYKDSTGKERRVSKAVAASLEENLRVST